MHIANNNWVFPLTGAFVLLAAFTLFTLFRDRRDLEILGYQNLILAPRLVWGRRVLKGSLLLGCFFLALLGAVRLQGKPVPEDLHMRGIDVMIVLDLSKSMLTQDLPPNRLVAAKRAIMNWLQNQDGDRVGLVGFAGEALIQVPLTMDLEAVALVLDRDDPDAVDRGGTDIGEGIRTALAAFDKEDKDSQRGKAILLITDGEATHGASNVEQACQEALEKKVPVMAVGIGTPQGKPIPDGVSFWGEAVYKRDRGGRVVISHLDEATLKTIADSTHGIFVQGDSTEALGSIQGNLDNLQKTEMKGKGAMRREEMAPALGALSAGLLFLSALI